MKEEFASSSARSVSEDRGDSGGPRRQRGVHWRAAAVLCLFVAAWRGCAAAVFVGVQCGIDAAAVFRLFVR